MLLPHRLEPVVALEGLRLTPPIQEETALLHSFPRPRGQDFVEDCPLLPAELLEVFMEALIPKQSTAIGTAKRYGNRSERDGTRSCFGDRDGTRSPLGQDGTRPSLYVVLFGE